MTVLERFWNLLGGQVASPGVSDEQLARTLRSARAQLPAPVFWLLGKAQAGKTSIIRGLTGASDAEIGDGFRPCTRTARLYPFPDAAEPLVQFLDTRGLGEAAYDPTDDMAVAARQGHVLLVVVKASDHALAPLTAALGAIRRAHPRWPVIVAQTTLHEAYPTPATQHVAPYPFAAEPLPETVPDSLARSLAVQREALAGLADRFTPIDFTLPEDGFEDRLYGLEALWSAIDDALPLGLRAMLSETPESRQLLRDARLRTAQWHILSYSLAAGGAALAPAPMLDLPLLVAIQAKMLHAVAAVYGQPVTTRLVAELSAALGVGFLARLGGRELLKFIPGVGSAVGAVYAAATTYALGRTLAYYFQQVHDGDVPDADALRRIYHDQYEEGRRRVGEYLDRARRQEQGSP